MSPRSGPRALPALLAALVLAVSSLVGAPTAAAHSELIGSDPADGATVTGLPASVTLTFGEAVMGKFTRVVVTSPAGEVVPAEPVTQDRTVRIPLPADKGTNGSWTVAYKIVSADTHPISGSLRFVVTGSAPASTSAATTSGATSTSATTGATTSSGAPVPTSSAATTGVAAPSPTSTSSAQTGGSGISVGTAAAVALLALALGVAAALVARRRRATDDQSR